MSGGQKQRTALGRTLVADPDVFLLDEPISHLDAKIRHELRRQFHTLEDLRKVTTVYVTHDYAEALSLGDRIGVMGNGGRLVQIGAPRELFERPADLFVAQHLGQPTINVIPVLLEMERNAVVARATKGGLKVTVPPAHAAKLRSQETLTLGLRPQYLRPADEGVSGVAIKAKVDIFEALGSMGVMIADVEGTRLTALTSPERHFQSGELVTLSLDNNALHYFDPATGRNLME